jgi:ketosteroid isomerase-like protein
MSQENVEIVRAMYAEWKRGDMAALTQWVHPDIDLAVADGPSPGHWTGLEAFAKTWRDVVGAWDHFRADVEEYRELGDGRVLVLTVRSGRGKASDLDLERISTKGAGWCELREGKVVRGVMYWSRERALADLGLEE